MSQHSVLAAIADGNSTNGGIANFVGRKSAEITHPLIVLENAALIAKEADLFRRGKWLYRVTEPLITFYEVVMRPEWFRLETGHADAARLARARDLLSATYDVSECTLTCYSAAGFTADLRAEAGPELRQRPSLELSQ